MKPQSILIAGANGLIGSHLSEVLRERGHEVAHLVRKRGNSRYATYLWDTKEGRVDPKAVKNKDVIINLAGANIGARRWTKSYKREILESRTQSTALLRRAVEDSGARPHTFISAAGISIYGTRSRPEAFTEDDPPGNDFLADVCVQWEAAADAFQSLGIRVVKIRTAPVLSAEGGLLKRFSGPVKWGLGAPLGSGEQIMNWIHIRDICAMYAFAIENHALSGAYNAVAPDPVTNREFTRAVARAMKKTLFLPPVPAFVLRLALGEMASLALEGANVSPQKIIGTGFTFEFDSLSKAMDDIF
jgi:uncharacterized protein (TIGR01777 family)